ncbi:hypothetical protein CLF_101452 [Clonorchis sinensis]|uniref:Uncharacterized protein n=1 Tax=Clonorchis sinensis TaxID=79923 RepID=H2KP74_CLOSI|nr:hypothetical protein CLF_101452 [Clonorchis sinensis]
MELELDNILVGTCITLVVCMISGILFYMFKHAAIISSSPPPTVIQETSPARKKTKNKAKKYKRKLGSPDALGLPLEQDADRTQTSDETVDEDEQPSLSNSNHHLSKMELSSRSSSEENTDIEHAGTASAHPHARGTSNIADGDLCSMRSFEVKESLLSESEACSVAPHMPEIQSLAPAEQIELVKVSELVVNSSLAPNSPQPSVTKSSKRSKRRGAKRMVGLVNAADASGNSSTPLLLPDVEHIVDPVEEISSPTSVSIKVPERSPSHKRKVLEKESNEELNKVMGQLRATERKLTEISSKAALLSDQNEQLRQKEEENRLGLHVLQQQYTELLRANKVVEHEKNMKENTVKHLESEKKTLLMRLELATTEVSRLKAENEAEANKLREQLNETQSKLAAVASAKPAVPNPELVRTQELAQLMSNENRLLKSSLDMRKAELTQLRQSHLRQQQELQAFQVENLKLRESQDTAIEELQAKFQQERAEANSRIASYEAQLQRQSHEFEVEKQELSRTLAEVKGELASRMDREKRLSEIISSLEYQFAELSAEKQRLLEKVKSVKAANESSNSELLIQVANLSNELTRTTSELHRTQQRADAAIAELEHLKAGSVQPHRLDAVVTAATQTVSGDCQLKTTQDTESHELVEHLRAELATTMRELKSTKNDLAASMTLQETTQLELEHYKSTLMHTEELLAKLQVMVEESESRWRKLLSDSESERDRLRKQLALALSKTAHMAERLERTEQKLGVQRRQSGRPQKRGSKTSKTPTSPWSDSPTLQISINEDGCATPELAHITPSLVTSPEYVDEPSGSPVDDQKASRGRVTTDSPPKNSKTLDVCNICPSAPERDSSPECKEVEGSWLELTHPPNNTLPPSPRDPRLCPDSLFRVHARSVSGAHWSSEVKPIKTSQLGGPDGESDDEDDFDAVLVDDTDLHVPDDIWENTTSTTISGNFGSDQTTILETQTTHHNILQTLLPENQT